MPSFSCPSSIRVASQDHALRLKITHNLVHGLPSDIVYSLKGRLAKDLDVLWLSDVTISLSGSLDGHQILAHDIVRSGLVHHLQTRLKANADGLGLNNVSRPFVDDADGLAKLALTPARPLPYVSRPHANLVSLHLAYIWKTVAGRSDVANSGHLVEEVDPFSPTVFLPAEALLNRVTEQFLIHQLVGRYPLIFGPWCRRLDQEMQYCPSIGHSIVEIMIRSGNHGFVSKCKRLLKIARSHHKFVHQTSTAALSSYTDDATSETSEKEIDGFPATPALTDEQILCESLEYLFRVGVPQRRFKPVPTPQFVSVPQDDDDNLLQCIPDAEADNEASWAELPEIAMSPLAPLADSSQTLPEGMDIFAEEDWPDDGMWHLHGAGTSLGERELDARSDESLISASIPPASITTRSPQACSFTLYHHLDVNYRERDPAASGLRDGASQSAYLEDSENSALFANLTRSSSHALHDYHYSENYEQLMQELGACQVDSESFETLDSSSEGDGGKDSDAILFNVDEDVDAPRQSPDDWSRLDDLDWDMPL